MLHFSRPNGPLGLSPDRRRGSVTEKAQGPQSLVLARRPRETAAGRDREAGSECREAGSMAQDSRASEPLNREEHLSVTPHGETQLFKLEQPQNRS